MQPTTKDENKKPEVAHDIHSFERAYKEAVFLKKDYLDVPSEFFDVLCKQYLDGVKADVFTYGKPGIKVYREGKREQIEEEGDLDVDDWTRLQAERNPNKKKKRVING